MTGITGIEEESFYIHVPSPIGLIKLNIQHVPTCHFGGQHAKADIVTQQVECIMANHSNHVHVQSNASNLECTYNSTLVSMCKELTHVKRHL